MIYIVIGVAGIIGAILRYFTSLAAMQWLQMPFPVGTLLVNMSGCLILGWFLEKMKQSSKWPAWFRLGVSTGLLGSYTTFSTFSVETLQLLENKEMVQALLYVVTSMIGGLLCAWMGGKLAGNAA